MKFAIPDRRQQLIIDSGFRCHLTNFSRAVATSPSSFVSRLRKYLKSRRVTAVTQIGTDRIIEIQFSDGQYRLFLEFYAGGNIILTNKDLAILGLFRIVSEGNDQEQLRVGLNYSLHDRQNFDGVPALTEGRLRNGLQKAVAKADEEAAASSKKLKKKSGNALRKALGASLNEFPPILIDHALRVSNFDPNTQVEHVLEDETLLLKLMQVLQEAQKVIDGIMGSATPKGYIIAKLRESKVLGPTISDAAHDDYNISRQESFIYEDFHPFRPRQFEEDPGVKIIEYDSFNTTVDEFFSSVEVQRIESRLSEREENAKRKLEAARQDHENRIGGLQQMQEIHIRKAQAIEANFQRVQEAMAAINGLVGQGMDWVEIARLVEMEQARLNTVAEIIKLPLKLYENTVTLILSEANFDEEADFEGNETGSDVSEAEDDEIQNPKSLNAAKASMNKLSVDVDLALSPWANARQYYDQKKTAAIKEQKTLESAAKALKSTERKIEETLKKGLKQEKQALRPVRMQFWFEKFIFFISSEGYLILSGKDALQTEIIYKKHLKKGDIYVHADLERAATVIIKNRPGKSDSPIPPSTLSQAGTLAVATSVAWDSKAVMSAWWVKADQISKVTSTGEYLRPGHFTVTGQKNFLLPAHLLLGFGVMFRISEESKARHAKQRINDDTPSEPNGGDESKENGLIRKTDVGESNGIEDRTEDPINDSCGQDTQTDDNEAKPTTTLEPFAVSFGNEEDQGFDVKDYNPLQPNARDQGFQNLYEMKNALVLGPISDAEDMAITSNSESESLVNEKTEENFGVDKQLPELESKLPSAPQLLGGMNDSCKNKAIFAHPESADACPKSDSEKPIQISDPLTSSSITNEPGKPNSKKQIPPVRGKRGKSKKIMGKYADQDDEDRAAALRLLGSTAAQKKAEEDLSAKKLREQQLGAQKEKQRQQYALAIERGKEAERIRQMKFQDEMEDSGDELDATQNFETFVGTPMAGDEILDALVVCGPWDAIGSRCRWRAKLQPGATKKGKAVREILGRWLSAASEREKRKKIDLTDTDSTMLEEEKMRRREGELLRAIREQEVVGLVPVNKCRVVMGSELAGGAKSKGASAGKGQRGGRGSKKQK